MLQQIEGSQAVAAAVALCRPNVVCAYPITPQTHIVEGIGRMVKLGALERCEFINVESEFAALSVAIGASAVGARAYTATASQGLLFMAEAIYNAAGLGLPIVMTVGNRAIGAPINIWNDHSDSMAVKDAGWIQFYAEDNQEAADLHIQAFKLAETLSCPVMICMDGFILTHAYEPIDVPVQEKVDAFLPTFEPVQQLDPSDPYSIGAMVGPDAFAEVRYLSHQKQVEALTQIPLVAQEFADLFGRGSGGLLKPYRVDGAETIVVALGSVNGTIKDVVDTERDAGASIGCVSVCSFRPFPLAELRAVLAGAKRVISIERSLAPGLGGPLASNIRMALRGNDIPVYTAIAGLGGRAITRRSLAELFRRAARDNLEDLTFMDLNWDVIHEQMARAHETRHSGPIAENLLRALNPGLVQRIS